MFLAVLREAFNPMVERSNRSRPTIYHKAYRRCKPFLCLIKKVQARTGCVVRQESPEIHPTPQILLFSLYIRLGCGFRVA